MKRQSACHDVLHMCVVASVWYMQVTVLEARDRIEGRVSDAVWCMLVTVLEARDRIGGRVSDAVWCM